MYKQGELTFSVGNFFNFLGQQLIHSLNIRLSPAARYPVRLEHCHHKAGMRSNLPNK
jgi:hypothetical protein